MGEVHEGVRTLGSHGGPRQAKCSRAGCRGEAPHACGISATA
ncbi:Hypothetical protein A7982_06722 [Minicystis rosea]|nr:Hypothetical protein A7982_06722 [Minicystis rosea]